MSDFAAGSAETPKDIGTDDAALVRRWLLEIKLAGKEEQSWRKETTELYDKYRGRDQKKNAFNILWANTEVLRQAVYSAQPTPDVRRRFKDADKLGKACAETLERCLSFCTDTPDFDLTIKQDILDMLIGGRGISRVRYVPSLVQVGDTKETGIEDDETDTEHESEEGDQEELAWEQVVLEHVHWDDFRRGPGRTWSEIPWVAFRHKLHRDELERRFGEKGTKLPLSEVQDEDVESTKRVDEKTADLFKTAEVWELWDKDSRKVYFIAQAADTPLQTLADPLELEGFFPLPRPLYAVEDAERLVPTTLYSLYKEQAEELNKVSGRINKITDSLKARGIYDSTLGELSELFKGNDNDLIPASGVAALVERGGLDKFIWFAPVKDLAVVLRELYLVRDQCKQTIYELTGISDIVRGATDPNETATAQGLKAQWGSLRLKRMQQDVQRYIRDHIRLMAEIIGQKFQLETLKQMTMLPYPTQQQVMQQQMQMQQQYQMQAQQAQMQGQQPPPPPQMPQVITWEQVLETLRNDAQRCYRVDIETDSTIAAELQTDMQGLQEVLTALGNVMPGLMESVGQGFLPFEAAKEVLLTICRRTRMGSAVEDAIDQMEAPQPKGDPEASKAQAQMQLEQMKAQLQDQQHQRELAAEAKQAQMMAKIELQKEQMTQALQKQQNDAQNQIEAQRMQLEKANEMKLEAFRAQMEERAAAADRQVQLLITQMNNAAKIEVAELSAQTTLQSAQISAAKAAETGEG